MTNPDQSCTDPRCQGCSNPGCVSHALSACAAQDRRGRIIAAFPATGKTYYASRTSGVADSDSSTFSRGPEWPANYIAHIRDLLAEEGATVLVSTHAEVRQALREAGIPFALAYPDEGCKYEYLGRMRDRGSPAALIEAVEANWRDWISQLRLEQGRHYVLTSGEYLADVIAEVRLAA